MHFFRLLKSKRLVVIECFPVEFGKQIARMTKRRSQFKTLLEKCNAIKDIEMGLSNKHVAVKYGVAKSTVSTWIKSKEKYLKALNRATSVRKSLRESDFEKLDELVYQWFSSSRSQNIPLNGNLIKEKALTYAKELGYTNFQASSGWLDRWKRRNGVSFKHVRKEGIVVSTDMENGRIETTVPHLLSSYSLENIYNADEFGLFFGCLPDKSFQQKSEKCHEGKYNNIKITGLAAANAIGGKLPMLVIGNASNPTCFNGIKTLPCRYRAQKNSCMDSEIFEEWVRELNTKFKAEKRKIALIVDDCPAHPNVAGLSHIQLLFLPPDTNYVSQPMDQGVIRHLKAHYRKRLVTDMIRHLDRKERPFKLSLLHAMQLLASAWNDVSKTTIVECFQKAKLAENVQTSADVTGDDPFEELNNVLEELKEKYPFLVSKNMTAEGLTQADDQVLTTASLLPVQEEDMLEEVITPYTEEVDEEFKKELDGEVRAPSAMEVEDSIEILRNYSLFSKNRGSQMQDTIHKFEALMKAEEAESYKRSSNSNFLQK